MTTPTECLQASAAVVPTVETVRAFLADWTARLADEDLDSVSEGLLEALAAGADPAGVLETFKTYLSCAQD